jgi:leucyl aminopeptidase
LPSGGALQAVRANFRYQGTASSCSTGAYDDHDDLVFTVGAGTPGFTVAAAPSTLAINQGGNGTSTVTVASQNSFSAATTLSVSGLPTGVTAAFSTNPVTPPANGNTTSALTLTASATATTGPATVTVTGTSGGTTASTTIALTVNAAGTGPQTAVYDTVLKTTKCATVGSSCDSGASLLLGRDSMSGGAEQHQPNTINSSCADGTSGTFHSDESNDRIVVATTDSSALTHGKVVKVTATIWAWNTGSSDSLDLYYTANANSPTWTLIGTIKPTAGGAQALSTTYTLPTGALQAIRANFRYQGSASSCSTGAYDDHDDLVFAVN